MLWSSTGVIISYLSRTYAIPSLVLAFWRDLFLSFALILVFVLFSRSRLTLPREQGFFFLGFGFIVAVFNSAWTFSVEFNGAAIATVFAFSSPAFTAILSHWILKEKISPVKLISILLSIVGIALISSAFDTSSWQANAPGIFFGLATGLAFAGYNLMGKSASNRGIDSWTTLLYSFGIATVFLFLFNVTFDIVSAKPLLGDILWLKDSLPGWSLLILLGIGPTLMGFGLYTHSLNYLPATVSNLIATLEPILTAIWAFFIFGEVLNGLQIFGGLLVFAGVVLLRLRD